MQKEGYNAKTAFLVCKLGNIGKDLLNVVVVFNFVEHFLDVNKLFFCEFYRARWDALEARFLNFNLHIF